MSSKAQVTEASKLNRITKKKQNCKEGKIYMQDQFSYPMCQGNCGKLYKIKSDMWLRLVLKWTNFQMPFLTTNYIKQLFPCQNKPLLNVMTTDATK